MTAHTDQNRFLITHTCACAAHTICAVCLSSFPSGVYHNNPHEIIDTQALKDRINDITCHSGVFMCVQQVCGAVSAPRQRWVTG